jgi:valyl-tRNA synthetase
LLHPFMPFLTEELWHQLPQKAGARSIALDKFPVAKAEWANPGAEAAFGLLQEVTTALRNIRADMKLDPKRKVAAGFSSPKTMARNLVQEYREPIQRLAFLSELQIEAAKLPQTGGAVRSTATFDVRIAYSDTVDVAAEKTRLKREREGLQKAIASKERQLGDETFRSRAPEKIIKGLEATLTEQRIELQKLQDRLSQIEVDS